LLERIVHAFEDGATPEAIVQSYDTLQLADVYAVVTWYLRHKEEVEDYLRQRAAEAEAIRRTIEAKQPDRAGLRARLLARRAQKEGADAPPAEPITRRSRDPTARNRGKTAEGVSIEVGAPASGIVVATSANALTPRQEDLDSGTWARDHPSRGAFSLSYLRRAL